MIKFVLTAVSDGEALREVAIKAFEDDRIKYGSMPPGIETLEWHTSKIEDGMYYKIMSDDSIVGGMKLYHLNDGMRLGSIFIEPEYQNQGVGSKAINFIESTYPHIKKWSLDTPYKNYRNHAFYEKHGYVKVDEFKPIENFDFWLFEYLKEIKDK